ncbi:5'-methylthioadenosine/S-adenosylhomocysteine nucleosidase family protein [Streptomyces sp. 8L]|uniref:5'-methylthioadenosine/S-adenosylhomocysteine nucleosidase family protein n=1 Tax=Streptomyces sp. 8L TaxID=2877242 RepID=UPI001CD7609B|nr:5'-methylthioadenosine/S-adenosylhomocysteine nucleosidase [Streptomyces sp. 8L]MCA1218572.1 5'-methylthioadenosine/S-adenosylhomocysteine nucleosidase [Streptomyces sp. 8L]
MSEELVVILTALNLEYQAVRQKLADPKVHRHERGTRFEVGTVQGTSCRVALGLTNKGNHSAAVIAERAIQEFSPTALLFVGVAGALWESARLGDVVMATHVYAYHGGTSEDDGLKARPRVWEAPHGISQLGSHVARLNDWADATTGHGRAPQVRFGAIAAGEVVQNSKISAEARWIRQHYNDALAIEMEAAGVAQAAHLNGAPVAVIRGISDRADGTKSSAKDRNWQPRAAANAAAPPPRLAVELVKEQEQITMSQENKARSAREPAKQVTNTAHNSVVGIMAGSVGHGSVHMNTAPGASGPTDLAAELDDFHADVKRHHAEGDLDDDTYQEALAELGFACRVARENAPGSSRTATMALKRLRGLIADSPELADRLAPLVRAAGDLS